jgi:hypothetical protein
LTRHSEENLSVSPWYVPGSPQWLRIIAWNLRNPFQNFRAFVIGVQDRNYMVTGKAPVMTVQLDDLVPPETGFQWCVLHLPARLRQL